MSGPSVIPVGNFEEFITNPFLIKFFQDSNLTGILEAFSAQVTELDAAIGAMMLDVWLDTAEGYQLDVLGIHLGLLRYGRDDTNFRTLLKLKASINVSSGNPEVILEVVRTLYNPGILEYFPVFPAKLRIIQDGFPQLYIPADMILEDGDYLELENGDTLVLQAPDESLEGVVQGTMPAGVGLEIATKNILTLDDGGHVMLDTGGRLLVVSA